MKPENLWINVDGEEVAYRINLDPDDLDGIVADQLRRCYVDAKTYWHNDPDNDRLCEALLTVLEHYMSHDQFEAWYETIKEL